MSIQYSAFSIQHSALSTQHSPADPAGTGLRPAGDGKMWWDDRVRPRLCRAGLDSFEAVMASLVGECLRALEDRENWHLELHGPDGQPYGVYLKKHHVRTWRSRLRAAFGAGPGETAGRVEAQNVGALTAKGISVMNLVAYGEKLHGTGLVESFVLTEELAGYTELAEFLRRRFPAVVSGGARSEGRGARDEGSQFSIQHSAFSIQHSPPPRRDHDLQRLIRQLADTVRRFHAAGYNHRDLYCCHFFVREPLRGEFEIRLIDLQRVQHRRRFRRRWLVKDLAQLAWSAPRDRIKCTHKMAFIRRYLGVKKLRPADKRLIRRVLCKQRIMEWKLGGQP